MVDINEQGKTNRILLLFLLDLLVWTFIKEGVVLCWNYPYPLWKAQQNILLSYIQDRCLLLTFSWTLIKCKKDRLMQIWLNKTDLTVVAHSYEIWPVPRLRSAKLHTAVHFK